MIYSIEKFAELIQDSIHFTEGEEQKLDISNSIDFDDFCVDFVGYAKGYLNRNAESILNEIYIESVAFCSLDTGCEIYSLDVWELNTLEKLIAW